MPSLGQFAQPLFRILALAGLLSACTVGKPGAQRDEGDYDDGEPDPVLQDPAPPRAEIPAEAKTPARENLERRGTDEGYNPYAGGGDPGPKPGTPPGIPKSEPGIQNSLSGRTAEESGSREFEPPTSADPFPAASRRSYRPPFRPLPPRYAGPDDEEYSAIAEHGFLDARAHPLSTFSIDVDAASYANVRRYLLDSRLPPRDAVRIEELINNFAFDYPPPSGGDPLSITAEAAVTPWNPATRLVLVGLQGRRVAERRLPPANLVFLIDVSGSMAAPDKLPLLRDAFDLLADRLRPQDRISIVVYAGAAGMVLPPTPGDDKEAIREALSRLEAGGSTAGGAGLRLAYQAARQSFIRGGDNRVILATDGDFNVGLSGEEELSRFIAGKRRTGVYLSVLGFGTGNYKDARMEALAGAGNGNYYCIDGIREARRVLVERMAGTLHAVARDVKVQVEFNPAAVTSYRLLGYEDRALAAEDFNDDARDAGELGAGHSVTALYEVVPAAPSRPRVDPLKYQRDREYGGSGREHRWFRGGESDKELLTVKVRYQRPDASTSRRLARAVRNRDQDWRDASDNFRFAAAVAGFGLLLRESPYRGDLGYDLVQSLARGSRGTDASGDRAEFLHLAGLAGLLVGTEAYGYPER